MSIRIRVYPQQNSVGARRNRAVKRQMVAQQRQINLANARLQRQLGATIPGGNPYGPASRMSSPFGAYGNYGGYGFPQQQYGGYGFPQQSYGGFQSPFGVSQFGMARSPLSVGLPSMFGGSSYYDPFTSLNSITQLGPFGTQQAYQAAANYGFGWA